MQYNKLQCTFSLTFLLSSSFFPSLKMPFNDFSCMDFFCIYTNYSFIQHFCRNFLHFFLFFFESIQLSLPLIKNIEYETFSDTISNSLLSRFFVFTFNFSQIFNSKHVLILFSSSLFDVKPTKFQDNFFKKTFFIEITSLPIWIYSSFTRYWLRENLQYTLLYSHCFVKFFHYKCSEMSSCMYVCTRVHAGYMRCIKWIILKENSLYFSHIYVYSLPFWKTWRKINWKTAQTTHIRMYACMYTGKVLNVGKSIGIHTVYVNACMYNVHVILFLCVSWCAVKWLFYWSKYFVQ